MKNFLKYLVALLLSLAACSGNETMWSTLPTEFMTDVKTQYQLPSEPEAADAISFTIDTPMDCNIVSDAEWCLVETTKGEKVEVQLCIKNNESSQSRTAHIKISSPKLKDEILVEVVQRGILLSLKGFDSDLNPDGGKQTLKIECEFAWTLESDAEWITFNKTSGNGTLSAGATEIIADIEPNNEGILRSAIVTLRSEKGKKLQMELIQTEPWETTKRVGDSGIEYDMSKIDPKYANLIKEWITAGCTNGIPNVSSLNWEVKEFEAGTPFTEIHKYTNNYSNTNKLVILKNGEYTVSGNLKIANSIILMGESRDGVIIRLKKEAKNGINLYNAKGSGVCNLTIIGDWSKENPNHTLMEEILPGMGGFRSINMDKSQNCFVDNVKILNSASHPIWITGSYNTIRDVEIDGAYNKGGGCQGYFFVNGSYNLITGCKITHLRHISFQDPTAKYNVFYKNNIKQEFSFHNNDGGNNLVEHNKIIIPETLKNYNAIMGPWSDQHKVGGINFVYRNRCIEENREDFTPWSDNELYIGPSAVIKANDPKCYENFKKQTEFPNPNGKTLYPIILK